MTATEILNLIISNNRQCSREEIDNFFRALSVDTLDNQIAMELTPNDNGTVYTLPDNTIIEIIEA